MRSANRLGLTLLVLGVAALAAAAQAPPPLPAPPPRPTGTAATVNGQEVPEVAVQRGLRRVPMERRAEARADHLDYLIDNALIDQYLVQLKVTVEPKDVEARLEQILADIKKQGKTPVKVFEEAMITEAELRAEVQADMRWDKFATTQATDAELRKFFDANRETFDGTRVRARHILLTPAGGDGKAAEQAKADLLACKKQVEEAAAAALAQVPAGADPLTREQARTKAIDEAFAKLAREKSACPSKRDGGDVDWFARAGGMVEPFARAAFALKPFQMSDVVKTQYGYHLILATDRRPGKEVKFEEVKADVKEVYCDRLREAVCAYMRPRATIKINPQPAGGP
jgi:peptidyl-prolyl cis-trans isomerase C